MYYRYIINRIYYKILGNIIKPRKYYKILGNIIKTRKYYNTIKYYQIL